jgi:transcriptional regulator GlxA family with amidase domain
MLQSAPAHNNPMETKRTVAKGKQQNGDAARDRWTERRDSVPGTRVLFLLLDGFEAFDLAGPAQVFYEAHEAGAPYRLSFVAHESEVESAQPLTIFRIEPLPNDVGPSDIVVVPGGTPIRLEALQRSSRLQPSIAWIRSAYDAGARIASVCVAAFFLGAAGLLDGRNVTTHWRRVDELRHAFPKANVQANRLYVFDGRVATSAGNAAGVDLALAIVERDAGPRLASVVAREMVLSVRRPGSQEQLSAFLAGRDHMIAEVHAVQDWLVGHPGEPYTLESLADVAGVSARTLTRYFRSATRLTVKEYANALRLEYARMLLRDGSLTIDDVASRCGLADGRHLRRIWREAYGSAPSESRGASVL